MRRAKFFFLEFRFMLLVMGLLFPFLFPFIFLISSSLKTHVQIIGGSPLLFFVPTFRNYAQVINSFKLFRYAFNSLLITGSATMLGLVLGLPAAYSIAQYHQSKLASTVLVSRMLPGLAYLIPWFLIFVNVGLRGSFIAVILIHLIITLPLIIWIMINFYEEIPEELIDAARVDGCSRALAFVKVALPLSKPGAAAATILSFIFSWNNFLIALIMGSKETRTLPVIVYNFTSLDGMIAWGELLAGATLVMLPVLLLALIAQKYIVKGLSLGSLKN